MNNKFSNQNMQIVIPHISCDTNNRITRQHSACVVPTMRLIYFGKFKLSADSWFIIKSRLIIIFMRLICISLTALRMICWKKIRRLPYGCDGTGMVTMTMLIVMMRLIMIAWRILWLPSWNLHNYVSLVTSDNIWELLTFTKMGLRTSYHWEERELLMVNWD